MLLAAVRGVSEGERPGVVLADVVDGVTHHELERISVLVVASTDRADVFVARSTYSQAPIRWCEREGYFLDPVTGSRWTMDGRPHGAQLATRGLDRLGARRHARDVVVDPLRVVRGRNGGGGLTSVVLGSCLDHVP